MSWRSCLHPEATRLIGIDPGLQKTGWGIIDISGTSLRLVDSGRIKPNPNRPIAERLKFLSQELDAILLQYEPHDAAIEETFVNQNPTTSLKLGMARGAAILTLANRNLSVAEYAPNKIKKSVTGQGHATKQQIGMMVKVLLPACGELGEDEADALAIAITHAHYHK
ncbi:MAG: crossover junction endodeoxyribonuclease RuvC [Rhodospirillales bacterium]|nr:crossover junction endodeoxyribonuclease RuvC [Rhodospirillales bacterium]